MIYVRHCIIGCHACPESKSIIQFEGFHLGRSCYDHIPQLPFQFSLMSMYIVIDSYSSPVLLCIWLLFYIKIFLLPTLSRYLCLLRGQTAHRCCFVCWNKTAIVVRYVFVHILRRTYCNKYSSLMQISFVFVNGQT